MDPSTTLITFLLQTQSSVQSVDLIGSWDNFNAHYPMQRDSRRGQGQWKGCHTFKDIICDDDKTKTRDGGLSMGSTYYYYYEINGETETFDKNMPSTNACPYLPGQTVNTLTIPREQTLRHRSISLNSMRITDFKTMDPDAKFVSPKRVEEPAVETLSTRIKSAPRLLRTSASSRSLSPAPAWRRLFGSKQRGDEERGRSRGASRKLVKQNQADQNLNLRLPSGNPHYVDHVGYLGSRSPSPASSTTTSRSRSIPPEELRRFLIDDTPSRPTSRLSQNPPMNMSDDIADEMPVDIPDEIEDDDNFAMLSPLDTQFERTITGLSPPPFSRVNSSDSMLLTTANLNAFSIPTVCLQEAEQDVVFASDYHSVNSESHPRSSTVIINQEMPINPSPADEMLTFYDDSNDEEDTSSNNGNEVESVPSPHDDSDSIPDAHVPMGLRKLSIFGSRFSGYSLPQVDELKLKKPESPRFTFGSIKTPTTMTMTPTTLVTSSEEERTVGSNFLPSPVEANFCLDDFVTELDWAVNRISTTNY